MVTKDASAKYDRYVISSGELRVSVITLGAAVTDILFRERHCALGYGDPALYDDNPAFVGVIVGRYANRIGAARFRLDGEEYRLVPNEGENQLHGGPDSWVKKVWEAEILSEDSVRFSLSAPSGENGFPGNMKASVTYTVTGNALRLDFEGSTDAPTVFAPTTHMYFNPAEGSVLEYGMKMAASGWLQVDGGLIPTGEIMPCSGEFDFSSMRRIGRDYDHCFVLDSQDACTADCGDVKISLRTDFPAMQFYTGTWLGEPFGRNGGFAIEPEFYPDSPNHPEWPSPVLQPGEKFSRFAEYIFT